MIYLLPAVTAGMLGYMMWLAAFRLRVDRVKTERTLSRGKHAFRPKERARFLLARSFHLSNEKPSWEEDLLTALSTAPKGAKIAGD